MSLLHALFSRRSLVVFAAFDLALAMPMTAWTKEPPAPVVEVCRLLCGDFSSAAQAKENKDYAEIHLHVREIWKDRADGPWLYVEQAAASALDKPYRQRIYQIALLPDGRVESRVFALDEPLRFAGAWRNPARFDSLAPAQLKLREGCSVFLRRADDGSYEGATAGKACESELRGATYATSSVTLSRSKFVSWDQGFDADGRQVWGATAGGYHFQRVEAEKEAK